MKWVDAAKEAGGKAAFWTEMDNVGRMTPQNPWKSHFCLKMLKSPNENRNKRSHDDDRGS